MVTIIPGVKRVTGLPSDVGRRHRGCRSSDFKSSAERCKTWVEGNFPQVTVWILEISCVAPVERGLRRLDDGGAGLHGLLHDGVDFRLRGDVVADGQLKRARSVHGQSAICRQALARPKGEL